MRRIEDYVFLKNPAGRKEFLVERDGTLWRSPVAPECRFAQNRQCNSLGSWKESVPGPVRWQWRSGWLPILEISGSGNMLELTALDDNLAGRINGKETCFFTDAGKIPLDKNCFEAHLEKTEKDWRGFFAGCRQPTLFPGHDPSAWKSCFVQALSSYCGRHPKYGTGYYWRSISDAFPPTTICMTDALLDYGQIKLALSLLDYFLERFVTPDGTIDYYGPSLAEYGMLLNLTKKIAESPEGYDWLASHPKPFRHIMQFLIRQRNPFIGAATETCPLLRGAPEADTRANTGFYTHNNAWAWRGLISWAETAGKLQLTESAFEAEQEAEEIRENLNACLKKFTQQQQAPPWLLENSQPVTSFQNSAENTYANYRYIPELLESGFLDKQTALQLVNMRENLQGEQLGLSLFNFAKAFQIPDTMEFCLDNWPIASYGKALATLGEKDRLVRLTDSCYRYGQSLDTFTAYESVEAENGKETGIACTDWCVPAQLVYPRLLKFLQQTDSSSFG